MLILLPQLNKISSRKAHHPSNKPKIPSAAANLTFEDHFHCQDDLSLR